MSSWRSMLAVTALYHNYSCCQFPTVSKYFEVSFESILKYFDWLPKNIFKSRKLNVVNQKKFNNLWNELILFYRDISYIELSKHGHFLTREDD